MLPFWCRVSYQRDIRVWCAQSDTVDVQPVLNPMHLDTCYPTRYIVLATVVAVGV